MRRKDRELTEETDLLAVIRACSICHVALADGDAPYIVPLSYGFVPGPPPTLYFHCAREGRKLELIARNPAASFAIDRQLAVVTGEAACDWGLRYESVLGEGTIGLVTDEAERRLGLEALLAQYGGAGHPFETTGLAATAVLKLTIRRMTGKRRA